LAEPLKWLYRQGTQPRPTITFRGSRHSFKEIIPVMKLVATTGPRNGIPLFIATQSPSEADKFVTTQMGQNIFAFMVEDVDLLRLREIVGSDVAYAARTLPRGHCIYKGHVLRVQRPVIAVVEKAGEVASVGKDLLTRWTHG
jgi:DNA helicase HerA-like ATPase